MWGSHLYDDLPVHSLFKCVFGCASLVLAFLFLAPHVAHAAFTLSWGTVVYDEDTGDIVSDDRIYLRDQEEAELPLGVTKKIAIGFTGTYFDVYGKLYRIDGSEREFVETFTEGKDFAWDAHGVYELDIFDSGSPILTEKKDRYRGFWERMLPSIARADTGDFLGTIRFTIKPVRGPNQTPSLSLVPDSRGVLPEKGKPTTTEFVFRLVYTDLDNDAPEGAQLLVDGKEIALEKEKGTGNLHDDIWSNGEVLTATTVFDDRGSYPFSFAAGDGTATTTLEGGAEVGVGFSNIAFFPGIQSSYLYKDGVLTEDQVWLPNISIGTDNDVRNLFLNTNGTSKEDIYTKEGDIILKAFGQEVVYEGYPEAMDDLVSRDIINEWKAIAYDWRLDLDTILQLGKQDEEKISHLKATGTPYIYQELKRLAESSESGKVSIIAHSNGGLLAKKLLKDLEDTDDPLLEHLDLLVLVAVPQLGTPKALLPMLHGAENPMDDVRIGLEDRTWRGASQYAPGAYNMLPSQKYFSHTSTKSLGNIVEFGLSLDALSETIAARTGGFVGDELPPVLDYRTEYGREVSGYAEYQDFLRGEEGRVEPDYEDIKHPIALEGALLNSTEAMHREIDAWMPPDMDDNGKPDIRVVQIAGFGLGTIRGIGYETKKHIEGCKYVPEALDTICTYFYGVQAHPLTTTLGDETVVLGSATVMPIETYYVDVKSYNENAGDTVDRKHFNIMGAQPILRSLELLIEGIVLDGVEYVSTTLPDASDFTVFEMHSPVELEIVSGEGRFGWKTDAMTGIEYLEEGVPNVSYWEIGESTYIALPSTAPYTINLDGVASGTFTFKIKIFKKDMFSSELVFSDVKTTEALLGTITISPGTVPKTLALDLDGNGPIDTQVPALSSVKTAQELIADLRKAMTPLSIEKSLKNALTSLSKVAERLVVLKRPLAAQVSIGAMELIIKQKTGRGITKAEADILLGILKDIKTLIK